MRAWWFREVMKLVKSHCCVNGGGRIWLRQSNFRACCLSHWEDLQISPLEVTGWTAINQQRIPCSMHKHVWEICALRHMKVGVWSKNGRWNEREGKSQKPVPQSLQPQQMRYQWKGWGEDGGGNTPRLDQTRGAGTTIEPGWWAHIEVGPRVRGRETAKKL